MQVLICKKYCPNSPHGTKILENRTTEISPIYHVYTGAPSTIIFHGYAANTVPFPHATLFCVEMKKYSNYCEVVPYEGRKHGFFNYDKETKPDFLSTMEYTVKFLTSLGYIISDLTLTKLIWF